MAEFEEAWNQRAVDRGSEEGILEEQVDNCREMEYYEPEEENKANNSIWEGQLTGIQCELTHRNGKYSIERTKKL